MDMFCVKDKAKKTVTDYQEVKTKNGRRAAKAKCPTCGTTMFRILGKA